MTKIHPHLSHLLIPMHLLLIVLGLSISYSLWMIPTVILLWVLFGGIGLELGYHRTLCHKHFDVSERVEKLLSFLACFSLTGSPTFWRALHVGYHHPYSDTRRDFHSAVNGGNWNAYIGYINNLDKMKFIGCRDMISDRFYSFVNNHYKKIVWSVTGLMCLISPSFGFVFVLAMLLSFHQASTVNVVCHSTHGYKNFDTRDSSNNIKWLSFITFGQALHNNHHAHPGSYNYAFKDGEYDVGLLLSKIIGLKPRKLS